MSGTETHTHNSAPVLLKDNKLPKPFKNKSGTKTVFGEALMRGRRLTFTAVSADWCFLLLMWFCWNWRRRQVAYSCFPWRLMSCGTRASNVLVVCYCLFWKTNLARVLFLDSLLVFAPAGFFDRTDGCAAFKAKILNSESSCFVCKFTNVIFLTRAIICLLCWGTCEWK